MLTGRLLWGAKGLPGLAAASAGLWWRSICFFFVFGPLGLCQPIKATGWHTTWPTLASPLRRHTQVRRRTPRTKTEPGPDWTLAKSHCQKKKKKEKDHKKSSSVWVPFNRGVLGGFPRPAGILWKFATLRGFHLSPSPKSQRKIY